MIVFDASTLILLAKIGLLQQLTKQIDIVIPEIIEKEATAKKDSFDAKIIETLIKKGKIKVKAVKEIPIVKELMKDFNMDKGESSVAVMFKELDADVIATDDGQLIKACKIMDIPFVTSIVFLIRAKQKGIIDEEIALEKLNKLDEFGWYKTRIIEDAEIRIKEVKDD